MRPLTFKITSAIAAFIMLSCGNGYIIPEKDMVKILSKIYLTDGITLTSTHSNLYGHDSIAYYEPIILSFGYTTAQFDSSIKYYSKRTEKFDNIFDKVVLELTRLQDKEKLQSEPTNIDSSDPNGNLWPLKAQWDMAIDHTTNPFLGFDIPVQGLGDYTFSFDAQIFPDDEAVNARHYIFFYFDDNTPVGVRENSILTPYTKDGNVHSYSYTFTLKNLQVTHLKGWLYDNGSNENTFKRHANFSNFKVTYTPSSVESKQDGNNPQKVTKRELKKLIKDIPAQ